MALLVILYFLIAIYVFRFQRTTLSLSREHVGQSEAKYQQILTPNWMGILGFISTAMLILIPLLFILQGQWIQAIVFFLVAQIGIGLIDMITPLPTYSHCFNIIEKSLMNDIEKTKDQERRQTLEKVLSYVKITREDAGK